MLMTRFFLAILTIATILQPIIYYYYIENVFLMPFIIFLLFLIIILSVIYNYKVRIKYGQLNYMWSIVIFFTGVATFFISETTVYVADALILMKEREEVIKDLKTLNLNSKEVTYDYKGILPISRDNRIDIHVIKPGKIEVQFETLNRSFLDILEKGVLYSDIPETIQTYERLKHKAGGVITERSFRIKKIKRNWYFYAYESQIIHD